MIKLLVAGFIAFAIALADSFVVDAHSFSDLHWEGKFFALIVVGTVVFWVFNYFLLPLWRKITGKS